MDVRPFVLIRKRLLLLAWITVVNDSLSNRRKVDPDAVVVPFPLSPGSQTRGTGDDVGESWEMWRNVSAPPVSCWRLCRLSLSSPQTRSQKMCLENSTNHWSWTVSFMLFLYDKRLWISRFCQRTNYLPSQVMMVPGDLHCDTDSNTVLCYTHVSIEMTWGGGRSPVIEIHEKVTVVLHCHFNFTMFAGPPKTWKLTVYILTVCLPVHRY